MKLFVLWACLLVSISSVYLSDVPEEGLLSEERLFYHEHLMDGYELYWNFNSTHIMFKTHVKTNGYIGFGISPNGGMANSDVVIGWVKDGQSYFDDRYAKGNYQPEVDSSQDWYLVNAEEVGDYTNLTFIRKLDTCDPKDLPITADTIKVIFSYNPKDPVGADRIHYHGGTRRGVKSVLLLNPRSSVQNNGPLPDDVITVDFLNGNVSLPGKDTTYFCKVFQLPKLEEKHHAIKFEPVIQPGNEQIVHHMILFYCPGVIDEKFAGESYMCYYETPKELMGCRSIFIGWAVGAQAVSLPEVAGFPLGTPDDPKIVILETHYNNPFLRTDLVDNSGLRMYITKKLRQYDAGVLSVGVIVDNYHIIPPNDADFLTSGHCHANCLKQALGDQEIRIVNNFPHSHLLGRKMRTRHFRDGIELEPIIVDNHYDFNYQEQRSLRQERVVKRGDSLLQECFYDSTGKTAPTFGGLSTNHEMCLAFLTYYPKISLTQCKSKVLYNVPDEFAGQDMPTLVKKLDWSDPNVRQKFRYSVDNSDILNECWFDDKSQTTYNVTSVPQYVLTYKEPEHCTP